MAAQAAALRRGVCAAAFRCWRHRELSPCLRAGRTSLCAELATKTRAWNHVTGRAELIPLAPLNLKTSFGPHIPRLSQTCVPSNMHCLGGTLRVFTAQGTHACFFFVVSITAIDCGHIQGWCWLCMRCVVKCVCIVPADLCRSWSAFFHTSLGAVGACYAG
jgi:hypothetical protein